MFVTQVALGSFCPLTRSSPRPRRPGPSTSQSSGSSSRPSSLHLAHTENIFLILVQLFLRKKNKRYKKNLYSCFSERISSCVVSQLAKHPGFDSHRLHNCPDWWLNPVSLLLGDKDNGMDLLTQVSSTWLNLKWLSAALVLKAEWSWVCEIHTGPDHIELWHCTRVFVVQGTGPN